jgi:hypothetical protein
VIDLSELPVNFTDGTSTQNFTATQTIGAITSAALNNWTIYREGAWLNLAELSPEDGLVILSDTGGSGATFGLVGMAIIGDINNDGYDDFIGSMLGYDGDYNDGTGHPSYGVA